VKVGDLIYHIDDWADKKPVVGVVLGFNFHNGEISSHGVKIIFTDKTYPEWWPQKELRHVEHDEGR